MEVARRIRMLGIAVDEKTAEHWLIELAERPAESAKSPQVLLQLPIARPFERMQSCHPQPQFFRLCQ